MLDGNTSFGALQHDGCYSIDITHAHLLLVVHLLKV